MTEVTVISKHLSVEDEIIAFLKVRAINISVGPNQMPIAGE
jgi:hypothetical protein